MHSRALHDLVHRWWAGELGAGGAALDVVTAPAEWVYRRAMDRRNAGYERGGAAVHPGVPVISVGNISVGGAGKTPFAAWLIQELLRQGRRPALLHGGYADDEPALHRRWSPSVPVIAERDRVAGARRALADGADVLVLDDAFQHRRIARDVDIVLVSAERWERNPRLLPRGPWREPPEALRRATVLAITRRTCSAAAAHAVAADVTHVVGRPVLVQVHLAARRWVDGTGREAPVAGEGVLVTAIAQPEAFLDNAQVAGATVTATHFWPDHHEYGAADAAKLLRAAGSRLILTTAKDWVKLAALLPAEQVRVLEQDVIIEAGAERLERALEAGLRG